MTSQTIRTAANIVQLQVAASEAQRSGQSRCDHRDTGYQPNDGRSGVTVRQTDLSARRLRHVSSEPITSEAPSNNGDGWPLGRHGCWRSLRRSVRRRDDDHLDRAGQTQAAGPEHRLPSAARSDGRGGTTASDELLSTGAAAAAAADHITGTDAATGSASSPATAGATSDGHHDSLPSAYVSLRPSQTRIPCSQLAWMRLLFQGEPYSRLWGITILNSTGINGDQSQHVHSDTLEVWWDL